MSYVFELTGPDKGKNTVILEKYKFVKGKMVVETDFEAKKIERILCRFYGCTLTLVKTATDGPEADGPEADASSLAKDVTKKADAGSPAAAASK